jgi:hypothetical protein
MVHWPHPLLEDLREWLAPPSVRISVGAEYTTLVVGVPKLAGEDALPEVHPNTAVRSPEAG